LPVEVSAADLIRLELISEEEAAVSLKQVAKKLMKLKLIKPSMRNPEFLFSDQRYGEDCVFLGRKKSPV